MKDSGTDGPGEQDGKGPSGGGETMKSRQKTVSQRTRSCGKDCSLNRKTNCRELTRTRFELTGLARQKNRNDTEPRVYGLLFHASRADATARRSNAETSKLEFRVQ